MPIRKVALLTSGGIAPCLSSSVAALVEAWSAIDAAVEIVAYRNGYAGLLTGDSLVIGPETRARIGRLHHLGGSPIGNSRVKLANVADCRRRGLVGGDEVPLEVAAHRLADAGVDVLHTIGGDDTQTTAAELAAYLTGHGYELVVVGLPKTIDNDIIPVARSLGADTAAEQSARFARHILAEHSANPRMLVVHEVMGRSCGWLTAESARRHHRWATVVPVVPGLVEPGGWDVHGVYLPELTIDVAAEGDRLRAVMDRHGCVNLFVSEGAGVDGIVAEMEAHGGGVPRDAFGHVKLDAVNPGSFLAGRFGALIGADKTLVAKSGYFARSAPANASDRVLIADCVAVAVTAALAGQSGLVGHDEGRGGALRPIELDRVAGGKSFDTTTDWFVSLEAEIGQATRPVSLAKS